jgi:hypothetical protein
VKLLEETGFSHPCAGWYLARTRTQSSERFSSVDPLDLVARKTPASESPSRLPQSVLYRDIGWAVLRSSWKDDATLLGVRSGFTWNHVHADAGSFVLFHRGVPLITDSGACGYSDPLYQGYYVQSRAHNVILFNGEGQPREDIRRGVKVPGEVCGLLDGAGMKYVYADSTGPMARHFTRNYRHWLWIHGAILIFDDVRAHEEGRFDWLLHYDGTARWDGAAVSLSNGAAKAELRFLSPGEMTMREEMGHPDHRPKEQVPYFAFSPKTPAREQKFIVAITPGSDGAPAPELEPLTAPLALGVRIRQGGEVTDVYLNLQADGRRMHENTNNVIDGWETDAYLFAVTRPENAAPGIDAATRYFLSCGSYLRREGRVVVDSLSKVDAAWRAGSRIELIANGQDDIELAVSAPARPSALSVNGRDKQFRYLAGPRLAEFRMSGGK